MRFSGACLLVVGQGRGVDQPYLCRAAEPETEIEPPELGIPGTPDLSSHAAFRGTGRGEEAHTGFEPVLPA